MEKQQFGSVTTTVEATSSAAPTAMSFRRYKSCLYIVIILLGIQVLYAVVYKFELLQGPVYGAAINSPSPRAYYPVIKLQQIPTSKTSSSSSPAVKTAAKTPLRDDVKVPNDSQTHNVSSTHTGLNISSAIESSNNVSRDINITEFERMQHIRSILATKRNPNDSFIDEFRNQLNAFVDTHSMFIVNQGNVKSGQALHFSFNKDRNTVISDSLFKSLPKKSPFTNKTFERCSVVGSGGILRESRCGADIDKSDYIFRCNSPPVEEFKNDAGSTTNLTTLNPSLVWSRFHNLHSKSDRSKFIRAMQDNNGAAILLPLFSLKSAFSMARQVTRVLNTAKNPRITTLIIHPKHFTRIQEFWGKRNISNRISTGFYLTSVAIALCDEVHLYGFWPFPRDMNQNNVSYHYYEDLKLSSAVHDFPLEFSSILELHRNGLINLHVHPCNSHVSTDLEDGVRTIN